tara:strand:- start:87 stop:467 length:381 start_codon:yes stop_codon:yes gene_type:complete
MDKRSWISVGGLLTMVFFAFGSVDSDMDAEFGEFEDMMEDLEKEGAATASTGPADGTGDATCDEYVKRYRCLLEKTSGDTGPADQMHKGFKMGLELSTTAEGKKIITDNCKQGLDMQKAALESQGC